MVIKLPELIGAAPIKIANNTSKTENLKSDASEKKSDFLSKVSGPETINKTKANEKTDNPLGIEEVNVEVKETKEVVKKTENYEEKVVETKNQEDIGVETEFSDLINEFSLEDMKKSINEKNDNYKNLNLDEINKVEKKIDNILEILKKTLDKITTESGDAKTKESNEVSYMQINEEIQELFVGVSDAKRKFDDLTVYLAQTDRNVEIKKGLSELLNVLKKEISFVNNEANSIGLTGHKMIKEMSKEEAVSVMKQLIEEVSVQKAEIKQSKGQIFAEKINLFIEEASKDGDAAIEVKLGNSNDKMTTESNNSLTDLSSSDTKSTDKAEKTLNLNLNQLKEKMQGKMDEIEKMVAKKDKILVQLKPEGLGKVEMLFKKTAGGIEISVELEKHAAKNKVEVLLDEIRRDFKDRNVDVNFEFKQERDSKENKEKDSERKNGFWSEEGNEESESDSFEGVMKDILEEVN